MKNQFMFKIVMLLSVFIPFSLFLFIDNPSKKISNYSNKVKSCVNCGVFKEKKSEELVEKKYDKEESLSSITRNVLQKANFDANRAIALGAKQFEMQEIQEHIREGQWRWDYAIASHTSLFHSPKENLKTLCLANKLAQKARRKLTPILKKYGVNNDIVSATSVIENSQHVAGLNLNEILKVKLDFKGRLQEGWIGQVNRNVCLN